MDYERLKNAVRKIEMSDEMKARVIQNCELSILTKKEAHMMKKTKTNRSFKKSAAAAAVLALFLCFTGAGAAAAGRLGFFRDIMNWKGEVIGTKYEKASEEIKATVSVDENAITVHVVVADPTAVPYSEIDTLGIESYQIIDGSNKVIANGENTQCFDLIDGKSEIMIPADHIGSGEYKLVIRSFVGAKKGDQPLQINGTWECDFVLNE